ncbi:zinc metalloprotease HtpX [Candidatus Roizmanbacteria bacterium CG_4_10_14_0_8_um_filter_33_9]|uniref:Protease HtpX homolog n=1 Tax=Candidatus Roizmanbacteria bacterium CG_4_10_14_0_8_um_filter_33_9 TaxID=1974826 RepID=A0A2M7QIV7_9BACT|nr:MAG: zinc metalloprotease HtpX [Candidatus Roizmanbacteria bacterium CG_4_10_14_0_8_um_filter_33_9]
MTLYSQISSNRRKTYLIFVLFIFIISGFFYIVGIANQSSSQFLVYGLIFSIFSTVGSYFFSDKIVLLSVKAIPADRKTYFDFYTVTENLCIASGLPMPKLYVIQDSALNAFATGRDPKHAVVCATTGLLTTLERSEVEGVIDHELSHVKNYDILLASIVAVLVGTIALASDMIMRNFWWGGRGNNNEDRKGNNPIIFIILIASLIITPIVATLIQLAISRKREFLSDADGALISRNPSGLANALEKISLYSKPLSTATTSTAHLFISNPFKSNKGKISWLQNLFSTHPPIEERMRILRSM